ncbi:MAG: DUF333 domain-containing protein [Anaerolineae bacterium]|nr:DUF333 domain-containing protein [Anaerolineae bacterium]
MTNIAPGNSAVSVQTVSVPGSNIVAENVAPAGEPAGMANPASVHCQQQGGRVQIRSTDAGEIGMCVFSDGQECEEWAFYRGECTMTAPASGVSGRPSTAPQPVPDNPQASSAGDWIGTIHGLYAAQFDDYFQTADQSTLAGVAGQTADIEAQLIALRDTGVTVHIWGSLLADIPDAYGSQIEVTRLEVAPAETLVEWVGVIVGMPASGQFDDCFQMQVDWNETCVGIDGASDEMEAQLAALRDTGTTVHISGVMNTIVPDVNGAQIRVESLETILAETETEWIGTIASMPAGGQFDDYFQVMDQDRTCFGIDGLSGAIDAQLAAMRDTGTPVRIRGVLVQDVPDAYGSQIRVAHIETAAEEMETEWIGTIASMPAGSQYDDYFQMMDQDGSRAGITGRDDDINKRLAELRDTGVTVHIWGVFHKAVPDAYDLQIVVSRLETE